MSEENPLVFTFSEFEVHERDFLLLRNSEAVPVEPKTFRVLLLLLQQPHRLLTKEEILSTVWNDVAVSDNSLTRSVAQLRRLLGDDVRNPRFIATVPTVGYRFVADVSVTKETFASYLTEPVTTQSISAPHGSRRRVYVAFASVILVSVATFVAWLSFRPVPRSEFVERKLTASTQESPVTSSAISPDGKYLAYSDPRGVYLRQIEGGETHVFSLPTTLPNPHIESWFPDGAHLIVSAWTRAHTNQETLWVVSILGGTPHRLVDDATDARVSPDGRRVAFLRMLYGGTQIWSADSDGSNVHLLVSPAGHKEQSLSPPAWSPDSKQIAYIRRTWILWGSPEAQIEIRNLETSQTSVPLADANLGSAVLWPTSDGLLYTVAQLSFLSAGDIDLWYLPLVQRHLRSSSFRQRISHGPGIIADLSATSDGKNLAFRRAERRPDIYIADVPAHSSDQLHPGRLSRENWSDFATAWTPDSRYVLFASDRGGTSHIFRQSIDASPPELLLGGTDHLYLVRLSPAGDEVIYVASPPGDTPHGTRLLRAPISGGSPHVLLAMPDIWNVECPRTPLHQCLLSVGDSEHLRFILFDPVSGARRDVLSDRLHVTALPNWGLSPDGSQLAVGAREPGQDARLRIVSLANGSEHTIALPNWFYLSGVDWAADGKSLWISACTQARSSWAGLSTCNMLNVTADGRFTTVLEDREVGFSGAIPSPNGKYLALIGENYSNSDVWLAKLAR